MPANPVNAAVATARIVLVAPGQVWLRGSEGEIVRAWAPSDAANVLTEDIHVQVYLDAEQELNGWWDPASGIAVNQRGFSGPGRPGHGTPMACRGSCGLVWEAPAAARLIAGGERCLTCCGPLSPEDGGAACPDAGGAVR